MLALLDDDELIGVLRAWPRLESWCASGMLTAVAELARRRPADRTPSAAPREFPVQLSEFTSDEIAAALTLTSRTAGPGQDLGHGYGTEARAAVLELAFGQLDAAEACTEYLDGNHASEKVSRKLGYTGNGQHVVYRDDTGRTTEYRLRLDRRTWETNRGDTPCAITGIKPCLIMFGLSPSAQHDDAL